MLFKDFILEISANAETLDENFGLEWWSVKNMLNVCLAVIIAGEEEWEIITPMLERLKTVGSASELVTLINEEYKDELDLLTATIDYSMSSEGALELMGNYIAEMTAPIPLAMSARAIMAPEEEYEPVAAEPNPYMLMFSEMYNTAYQTYEERQAALMQEALEAEVEEIDDPTE